MPTSMIQDVLWPDAVSDPVWDPLSERPLQYLGSKARVAGAIEGVIHDLIGESGGVADLFAGSGVVAHALAMRRPVAATDIQEYSRVLTSALVRGNEDGSRLHDMLRSARERYEEMRRPDVRDLIEFERRKIAEAHASPEAARDLSRLLDRPPVTVDGLAGDVRHTAQTAVIDVLETLPRDPGSAMTRYYGGIYFSFDQALVLDSMAAAARASRVSRDLRVAAVISMASEFVASVGGHFAQPLRLTDDAGNPKVGVLGALVAARRKDPWQAAEAWLSKYATLQRSTSEHWIERLDYGEALGRLPQFVKLVYADPPYTRDHYSRFYHVLETIAIGDEPGVTPVRSQGGTRLSRGGYRAVRHQSPFSIRSKARLAFASMFGITSSRGLPIVVSYSPSTFGTIARPAPRVVTVEEVVKEADVFYRDVRVVSIGNVAHSKFNQRDRNAAVEPVAEVLVVAVRPR
jgi:adenine-specific DNA-methyltransferase